jgi:GNAT superfamily N-acetyltransferase
MAVILSRPLGSKDLEVINDVVTEAVMAWPLPERMKRLSLPVLRYDAVDLEHFSAIGAYCLAGTVKPFDLFGVALWDDQALHGLYVRPEAQGRGVGRSLLETVAARAQQAGIPRLLVKAERVAAGYFQQLDLAAAGAESPYPYAFYLDTADFLAFAHRAGPAHRAGDHVSRFLG